MFDHCSTLPGSLILLVEALVVGTFCFYFQMLGTLILLIDGLAAFVFCFLFGTCMFVSCGTHTHLKELAIISLERLISGICLFVKILNF